MYSLELEQISALEKFSSVLTYEERNELRDMDCPTSHCN